MKMNVKSSVLIMVLVFVLFIWVVAAGGIPQEINYQGKLTDPSGNPLSGSYGIVFTIYDADTGGASLWTETRTVPVSKGIFNVILGETNPISMEVFSGDERWLGIKVGADAEMTPRAKIVSVGNAFLANDSENLGGKPASYYEPGAGGNFVSRDGDTMTGPLTIEAEISAEGLIMGRTTSSDTLNRVHINAPTGPDNNAVVNVGGELDGSIAAISQPANMYSAQIFGQARNDGTGSSYIGVWGKSDRNRNSTELIGMLGEAYGANFYGLFPDAMAAVGGTPSQPIANMGLFAGYAANFSLVAENFNGSGGGGLLVSCSNETGSIFEANSGVDVAFGGSGLTRYFRIYKGDAGDRPQVKLENNAALILASGSSIEMTDGSITTGGYVSAETYYGDGSHLTGIEGGGGGGGNYISKEGDTMGTTEADAVLNRFRYNMPDGFTPGINSVISVGGEYIGALNGVYVGSYILFPAGSVSTQIFGQAKNDGTATGGLLGSPYAGIVGLADAFRDPSEVIGIAGVAYGTGSVAGLFAGGDSDTPSAGGLLITGNMSDYGLQVNNQDITDNGGVVADFKSSGATVLKVLHNGTHFESPAYFGEYDIDTSHFYSTISTYTDDYYQTNLGIWGSNVNTGFTGRGSFPDILANGGGWDMDLGHNDGFRVYYDTLGDGESSTVLFEVPPPGSSAFLSGYAVDASDAVGIIFDNVNPLATEGAKLVSIRNSGAEIAYVDKDGVYHSASGSTEGGVFISKTGDTMGMVDTGTALNRFRFNVPDGITARNHSVLSVGGEFDGSILENAATPPDTWSTQLFCQASADATANVGVYSAIWAKSDLIDGGGSGLMAEAYGPDWNGAGILPTAVMGFGGTPDVPIANLGYFEGYADAWGLQVNNWNTYSGGGLLVNSYFDTGSIAHFEYQGSSILNITNYGSHFVYPAWFGDGNIAGYYDGSEGGTGYNLGIYGRNADHNNILATANDGWNINCDSYDGLNVYTNTSGDSPLMLRVPTIGSSAFLSGYVENYDGNVGIILDNYYTLGPDSHTERSSNAELVSIRDAGVEKACVNNDGTFGCSGEVGGLYLNNSGNSYIISSVFASTSFDWNRDPNLVIQSNASDDYASGTGVGIRNGTTLSQENARIAVFQNYRGGEVPFEDVASIYANGSATFTGTIEASDSRIRTWHHTPASSNEAGTAGLTCYDSSYFYVWVTDNNVKRTALSNW